MGFNIKISAIFLREKKSTQKCLINIDCIMKKAKTEGLIRPSNC